MCAALSAREAGARVLVVEKAPEAWRGGNGFFTAGGFRFAFKSFEELCDLVGDLSDEEKASMEVDPYTEETFYDDLMRVTEDCADPDLAMLLVRQSQPTVRWMRDRGVRWIPMFGRQAYKVDGRFRSWGGLVREAVGGRPGLVDTACPWGHWSGCHAVQWDLNAPWHGDRKVGDNFQKHSYPLGLIVNLRGERFVDEGADFRNYTYVKYGRAVIEQPRRAAFQIFDAKVLHLLREEYRIREVTEAEDPAVEGLARQLEIDGDGALRTVAAFNAAVEPGAFNPAIKDGKRTRGIAPPKSNWALPLDAPPYVGYAVTTGITFTFGGLRITDVAQVVDTEQRPIPGLFAAGELVGGLFYHNYPGGAGLMAGAVFGRIAGRSAASSAGSEGAPRPL